MSFCPGVCWQLEPLLWLPWVQYNDKIEKKVLQGSGFFLGLRTNDNLLTI